MIVSYGEDATQDNTLTILLSDANRQLTVSGTSVINQDVSTTGTPAFAAVTPTKLIHGTEALTPTGATGVASVAITTTIITSETGGVAADAVSLAAGTIGQIKTFIFKTETDAGDTIVITPAAPVGFATITFDAVGDTATLQSDGTSWHLISHYNATIG